MWISFMTSRQPRSSSCPTISVADCYNKCFCRGEAFQNTAHHAVHGQWHLEPCPESVIGNVLGSSVESHLVREGGVYKWLLVVEIVRHSNI